MTSKQRRRYVHKQESTILPITAQNRDFCTERVSYATITLYPAAQPYFLPNPGRRSSTAKSSLSVSYTWPGAWTALV
jgi:hypothetical protein